MLFVLSKNKLFELTSHSTQEGFCSFFIDQTVEQDGKIYTITPFDARRVPRIPFLRSPSFIYDFEGSMSPSFHEVNLHEMILPSFTRFLVLDTLREAEKFVELSNYFEGELSSAVEHADLDHIADIKGQSIVRYLRRGK